MSRNTTVIIEDRYMPKALKGVPPAVRDAIVAVTDDGWAAVEADYLGGPRAGHPFEARSLLRRWLEGNDDGRHVGPRYTPDEEAWVQEREWAASLGAQWT